MFKIIYALFKAVLYSSAYGSFVAIIILLVKRLFKNKLSASWHYYIWILLIIRLAIPYSYQSSISIFNIFIKPINNAQISLIAESNVSNSGVLTLNKSAAIANSSLTKFTIPAKTDNLNLFNIASIIWFFTMLIVVLLILIFYIINNRKIRYQLICKDKETINILNTCKKITCIKCYVPVICSSNINGVSLYGFFKPQIIISNKIVDKFTIEQKKFIFLHELIHLKYKDILINWVMHILAVINWFNPILLYSFYKIKQDCELACDEKAMSYLEPINYKNYGNTVINMAALFSKSHNMINSTAFISDKKNLKRRIAMIRLYKGKPLKWSIIGLVLIFLLGLLCLVNPKAEANNVKSKLVSVKTQNQLDDISPKSVQYLKKIKFKDIQSIEIQSDGNAIYRPKIYDFNFKDSRQTKVIKNIINSLNSAKIQGYDNGLSHYLGCSPAFLVIKLKDGLSIYIERTTEGTASSGGIGSVACPNQVKISGLYNEKPIRILSPELNELIYGGYNEIFK